MLIISRRENEAIVFPSLGIRVNVARIGVSTTRLGIVAPKGVRVLRDELLPAGTPDPELPCGSLSEHHLRNTLSKFSLALHLARKQLAAGFLDRSDETLANALEMLETLDSEWSQPVASQAKHRPVQTALIVEDDPNQRELLAGLLQMNGCSCDTASDGEDALTYLSNGARPDVVLLDMGLPRCNGPEMIKSLRADERLKQLRVWSVSGTDPRTLGVSIGEGGVDGWFRKPLNPVRLWDAIQKSLSAPATLSPLAG